MIVEQFKPEHIRKMRLRDEQRFSMKLCSIEYLVRLRDSGPAVTLRTNNRLVIACAGVADTPDASVLWAFLSCKAPDYKMAIARGARRLVEVARRPVIATTPHWFGDGCKLLEFLGMSPVGPCDAAIPELRGHVLYRMDA